MKKVMLLVAVVFGLSFATAQDEMSSSNPTSQGTWLVEMNTGFGTAGFGSGSSTGLGYAMWKQEFEVQIGTDKKTYEATNTQTTFGLEGGYFVADNFVAKAGLGYVALSYDSNVEGSKKYTSSGFSWMLGSKYYIVSQWPVQLDLRGTSLKSDDDSDPENPLWLGLQGGYAWFITDNMSLEPGIKYNFSLNEDYASGGAFEFRIGFAAFF